MRIEAQNERVEAQNERIEAQNERIEELQKVQIAEVRCAA